MRFEVLGPLRVRAESGDVLEVRAAMVRRLLAVLLCHPRESVSMDALVDALWPNDPPERASRTVQLYITRLRRVLGESDRVVRQGNGYLVRVDPGELDSIEFVDRVRAAARERDEGRLGKADDLLADALADWRGEPFADTDCDPVRPEAQRLMEWRVRALEDRADVALRRGRHAEVVPELSGLAAEFPYRERLAGLLMVALYRSDRQADALEVYRRIRARLDDELGVEPGRELQRLHEAVLRCAPELNAPDVAQSSAGRSNVDAGDASGEPASTVAGSEAVVPAQLPPDLASMTGRDVEVSALVDLATGHSRTHGTAVVGVIDGMAGVGKTVVAVRAAHRLADDYPDGQLFLDLHGFTAGVDPVEPNAALDRLLRAVGVSPETIPHDLEERTALWRSLCVGRRLLIVLDNAMGESQVRPILPAEPGCLVLVTSRRRLSGLDDALPVSLDVLPAGDAASLFVQVAGAARLRNDRAGELSPADIAGRVARIVDRCGHLPLAIRLAAARFRARPTWRLDDLLGRLEDQQRRLEELEAGERDVAGAFALSYDHLGSEQQRMFRLLGLVPGTGVDAYGAAALADIDVYKAERILEDLVDLNLIHVFRPDRYGFHDLMRAHAVVVAVRGESEEGRQSAIDRLCDYYVATAQSAASLGWPDEAWTLPEVPEVFALPSDLLDSVSAHAWLGRERTNVLMAVEVVANRRPSWVIDIAKCLQRYLYEGGYHLDASTLHERRFEAARSRGDDGAQAGALNGLGITSYLTGRPQDAVDYFERAVACAERALSGRSVAAYRANFARALGRLGRLREAIEQLQRSADEYRAHSDGPGEGSVLGSRASILVHLERHEEALELAVRACDLAGTSSRLPYVLQVAGRAALRLGRPQLAVDRLERALDLFRERAASPSREAEIGADLACVLVSEGKGDEARQRCEEGLVAAGRDRNAEYDVRRAYGEVQVTLGHPVQAVDHLERAVELARQIGQVVDEAMALDLLGRVYREVDRHEEGVSATRDAHEIYRRCGMPAADRMAARLVEWGEEPAGPAPGR